MIKKIIFIVILLALIGGGYWYVGQKKEINPTLDWQTFRSDKYGYEVKYPTDIEIKNLFEGKALTVLLESYLNVPGNLIEERQSLSDSIDVIFMLDINPASNPTNLPLTAWLEENVFSGHRSITPAGGRETTLAGEPAYYIEQNHNGKNGLYAYTRYTIYTLHNGNLYQISGVKLPQSPTPEWLAHPYYQYLEQSIPISEAILNSFRFLD